MRIISGKLRGRKFTLPSGKWPVRPTTDFAKEGLFNVLVHQFDLEEMSVLELFGGTGNFSFEFVSRGCSKVTYVDKFYPCVKFVKETAESWNIGEAIQAIRMDAFQYIDKAVGSFDLIVADPPYDLPRLGQLPTLIKQSRLLKKGGWFILEHNQMHEFEQHEDCFMVKHYGKTFFSYFSFD
ncbi:MAG TPA: methyltransferase domain-containing protein [Saprospiraceae bacterium]|nr:methyltransferase domain-containing protein [Saprospiraceae bacterium]